MDSLKKYLDQFISFNEKEWTAFSSLFAEVSLPKGTFFAREGQCEKHIGFLLNGVVRAFYRNSEGHEYNKTFFTDLEFIGAYTSLITGNENQINIQALTDCRVLVADYTSIKALFPEYRQVETFARLMAESFYAYKEKREIEVVLLQADERYKLFKAEYPGLENLIPQYHIASYLGITPTQLSRIRGQK